MSFSGETASKWISLVLGGISIIVTVSIAGFSYVTDNMQSQIDNNMQRIWEIKATAVTESNLDNQVKQMRDYIDVRIEPIEAAQKEMMRTINENAAENRKSDREIKDALSQIATQLVQKADR